MDERTLGIHNVGSHLFAAVPDSRYKAKVIKFLQRLIPAGPQGCSVPHKDIVANDETRKKILCLLIKGWKDCGEKEKLKNIKCLDLVEVPLDYSTGHHSRRYALTKKAANLLRLDRGIEHYEEIEQAAVPATWTRSEVRLRNPHPLLVQGLSRTGITVDRQAMKKVLLDPNLGLGKWQNINAFYRHVVRFPEGADIIPQLVKQSPKCWVLSQCQPCLQTQPNAHRQKYLRATHPDRVLVNVDYHSFHAAIVLYSQGRPIPKDAYAELRTPGSAPRSDWKKAINIYLNGVLTHKGIQKEVPSLTPDDLARMVKYLDVEEYLRIPGKCALGNFLRRVSSVVLCQALNRAAMVVPALGIPLHDGAIIPVDRFLVENGRVPVLEKAFQTAAEDLLGGSPGVDSCLLEKCGT